MSKAEKIEKELLVEVAKNSRTKIIKIEKKLIASKKELKGERKTLKKLYKQIKTQYDKISVLCFGDMADKSEEQLEVEADELLDELNSSGAKRQTYTNKPWNALHQMLDRLIKIRELIGGNISERINLDKIGADFKLKEYQIIMKEMALTKIDDGIKDIAAAFFSIINKKASSNADDDDYIDNEADEDDIDAVLDTRLAKNKEKKKKKKKKKKKD